MKKSASKFPEVYDSIDAPIFVWYKVHDSSDLSWLLVKRKKVNKSLLKILEKAWEKIYNEYVSEFGFSENFRSLKEKELEIAKLQLDLILTNDRTLKIFIKQAQLELVDMQGGGNSSFMESKIAIESHFKFQVNMMQTSIREFYSYLKHLK